MSRLARAVVLATAFMSMSIAASPARAVTWHNAGDTAFTASGGAFSAAVTGVTVSCTGSAAAGTVATAPFVGTVWPAMTFTTTYSGCLFQGQSIGTDCTRTFTATSSAAGATTGTVDTTCRIYLAGVLICKSSGSVAGTYVNPTAPSTFGRLTLPTSSTLRTSNGAAGQCPFGIGDTVHNSTQPFTITTATGGPSPHLGPIITRTA